MKIQASKGARSVILCSALLIGASLTTIVWFLASVGADRLPQQTIRLAITCAVCWQLYRGKSWARWLIGLPIVPGLVLLAVMIANDGFLNLAGVLFVIYATAFTLLIAGPGVNEYFKNDG